MSWRWTADDFALLRHCADSGLSTSLTARELDRTQPAVWQMARRLGVSFHGGPGGAPKGNDNRRLGMTRKLLQTEGDDGTRGERGPDA